MSPQWLDAIAKSLAALTAGIFFLWKYRHGYHIIGLKVSTKLERTEISENDDVIIVTTVLKKGDTGSLSLHDMQARFSWDSHSNCIQFVGIKRLSYATETSPAAENSRTVIDWSNISTSAPFLNLAPGDEVEFACHCEVPKKSICVVEVAALGVKAGTQWKCQWRSSAVSPPSLTLGQ